MAAAKGNIKVKLGVPEPTLKRLPQYLFYLKQLRNEGEMNITAPLIGKALGYDNTQVVKDLSHTGVTGKPRVGYNIYEVIQALEEFLGFNRNNEAFLVGAGNLGSALMSYQGSSELGVKIIAGFDTDADKIGSQIGGVHVLSIDKLADLAGRLHIKIGILCVPSPVAQKTCNLLVKAGIKAIWNLTPTHLTVPEYIVLQNTSMYSNVAVLLRKLHDSEQ